jgi:hypothetical protein
MRLLQVLIWTLFCNTLLAEEARDIAKKMIEREDGKSSYSKITLLSCDMDTQSGKKKCLSKPRKKRFEEFSKDLGEKLKDTTSVMILISPAYEKGVGFLQRDFDQAGKDSEQWLYLPALKKLKLIVSEGGDNRPKTGSLFESEIAYEDIENVHLSDFSYKLIKEGKVGSRNVWVIDSFPSNSYAPKTSYGRNRFWVDKASYIPLKSEHYNRQNTLVKTFHNRKLKKISGIWDAQQTIVVNHARGRMSLLKREARTFNITLADKMLETRILTDKEFREDAMNRIRSE